MVTLAASLLLMLLLITSIPGPVSGAPSLRTPKLLEAGGISELTPILKGRPMLHIPLHLIVDKAAYRMFGSEVYPVQRYCSELVQIMNLKFQDLYVRVVLVRLEIWSRKDGFTVGNNSMDNYNDLVEMLQLRETIKANGSSDGENVNLPTHTQLLTGIPQYDDEGRLNLGRASLGSICTDENASVVRMYGICELHRQATTCMHELGHAIGLEHTPEHCAVCIMSPSIATGPSQNRWTMTNAKQFARIVSQKRCLFVPRPPAQFRREDMLDAPKDEIDDADDDDGTKDSREDYEPCLGVYRMYQQGPQLSASAEDARFETYELKHHARGESIRQAADFVYIVITFLHLAICSSLSYINYMERRLRTARSRNAASDLIKLD